MALLKKLQVPLLRHARLAELNQAVHTSSAAFGIGSHASDNNAEVLESEKAKTLKGTHKSSMKSHPGWNEKLASDSEVPIKSDKEELHAEEHEEHITKLQDHTVKHIKEVHVEYEGKK
jgi:hypothetical protein